MTGIGKVRNEQNVCVCVFHNVIHFFSFYISIKTIVRQTSVLLIVAIVLFS